jgi:hypothetical protein
MGALLIASVVSRSNREISKIVGIHRMALVP